MEISKIRRKGYLIFKKGLVKKVLETDKRIHFEVKGESDVHFVIFDKERKRFSCDCYYFALHQKDCSHIIAARLFLKKKKFI